ncbi:hypothetical protein [Bacillus piscicola]|uniref:hypothetical protein n=1 Tax=Bacillus piscicola TaxID=1632684 RepID=UPI001F09A528|nr:hypothetical protein [Bacillus piscicola]
MLKINVGIVGPEDTVSLILKIVKEYEDKITAYPFVYKHAEETTDIVKKNQRDMDIWFFSGRTPFTLAKKSRVRQPFFYLELNGTSLTHVLVKMHYKDYQDISRISVDMLKERDIYEAYQDLDLPLTDVFIYEYPGYTPISEIVDFHSNLYMQGKVKVCATCLRYVYDELKRKGIPVYRITPTKTNVRSTIETALQRWETLQFKQSQIAVMLIRTGDMDNVDDKHTVSYDAHRLNFKLQSSIIDYAETVTGSFAALGIGKFIIFSTRGSIEQYESEAISLLEQLALITDYPSHIGIGYGDSALAAEENARVALYHAQLYGDFCAFLVDNKGGVEGPLQQRQNISFEYRTENKEINAQLEKAGVTITTYNKMLSVQKNYGDNILTASIIAEWLKMTERNARRILNSLVTHGLAEIIGKEAPKAGRPRQIFRIKTQ